MFAFFYQKNIKLVRVKVVICLKDVRLCLNKVSDASVVQAVFSVASPYGLALQP